jgi:serine/threonine-protein kinase
MSKREKFGKFVLLEEIDTSGLGVEYRAARLGPAGLDKIVTVLRLAPSLSANAEAVKLLMDQVKFAAQLQSPNVVKVLGIGGKVGSPCWVSYEFVEGKSLKAVFGRTQEDRFPFSVDHGLLIASKVAAALETAHARKTPGGERYFHGLVAPSNVIVTHDGEVKVRGFGYWPARVRELGMVTPDDAPYLAPEQAGSGAGGPKSDIFSVGAILYETLTGERLQEGGKPYDPTRLAGARLQTPATGDEPIPKPIHEILQKSLAVDPAARYADVAELRKAVDALLFSGDFTPTTFNLAFFMHSLYREDIDREAKALAEEKEASYHEFVDEAAHPEAAHPPAAPASAPALAPTPAAPPAAPAPMPRPPARAAVTAAAASSGAVPAAAVAPPLPPSAGDPGATLPPATLSPVAAAPAAPAPPGAVRDATAGFTFHKGDASGGKLPLLAGAGVLLLAAAAGAYFMFGRKGAPPPPAAANPAPTTLSAEALAAVAKVKELEEKLAVFEAEKAAAAAKAEDEAKKKVVAQAAARGQAVDPAALQRAQDDARRRAEAEQARRQQEERARIEAEQRAAEAQLAEQRRREEEARLAAAAAAATTLPPETTPATAPTPPPTTVPPIRPGALVQLSDPGVMAPVALTTPSLQYPPIALRQGIEGRVELTILVDEKGNVTDARVTTGAGGRSGLNEAAMENARKRRYRPGTKDGVPIKVWIPITVNFVLPR